MTSHLGFSPPSNEDRDWQGDGQSPFAGEAAVTTLVTFKAPSLSKQILCFLPGRAWGSDPSSSHSDASGVDSYKETGGSSLEGGTGGGVVL